MNSEIYKIGVLAEIDSRIDELQDELGDLPHELDLKRLFKQQAEDTVAETEKIINEIKDFCSKAKSTLVELKEREDQLMQQQFNVRNNKEFDAITAEIAHIKREHSKLSEQFRTEGLKLENLSRILEKQKEDLSESNKELNEKQKELIAISNEQDDEMKDLYVKREKVSALIKPEYAGEYNRIRTMHKDTAIAINVNSCGGCFNSLTKQLVVDVRNNMNVLYYCENCGRILLPEDFSVEESDIDKL
jgi:uncharacterized protein